MDVVEIYKRCFLALFFISFWSSHQAQTVSLVGRVEDFFLKKQSFFCNRLVDKT